MDESNFPSDLGGPQHERMRPQPQRQRCHRSWRYRVAAVVVLLVAVLISACGSGDAATVAQGVTRGPLVTEKSSVATSDAWTEESGSRLRTLITDAEAASAGIATPLEVNTEGSRWDYLRSAINAYSTDGPKLTLTYYADIAELQRGPSIGNAIPGVALAVECFDGPMAGCLVYVPLGGTGGVMSIDVTQFQSKSEKGEDTLAALGKVVRLVLPRLQ